ncbi:hypothetical protein ANCCEY_09923 [Ancylostoma ceylanicum]|uniref:DUF7622 domain-containing protein n=1 Tax=Ancylostoma ceylanicum TaxID=53326 RepID=A0A0D6LIF7_9BILA|nr:hypothetical protein ANCCEY_09923 [Ancylostoma ceylanicum]
MSELLVLLAALVAVTHALECYQCESEYGGVNDGDLCNNVERTENTIRPLPIVQLPVVECTRKVTGTGIFGSPREHVCSSNYCHMTRTESYSEDFPPDVLTVYNCGDISEFDFDLRLKNTIDFPGLYANGCYRIQYQPKESVTDCICSRNQCNTALPVVQSGPVRCYISHGAKNESVVDTNHFCDGDYCFVQKHNGKYTKGCLSVNERNSWSHLKDLLIISIKSVDDLVNMLNVKDLFRTAGCPTHVRMSLLARWADK